MSARKVVLTLNSQQIELLDRTVERGAAATREGLIRRALREYASTHAREKPERD